MDALVVRVITLQFNGILHAVFNYLCKYTVCYLSVLVDGIVCIYIILQ
jgi:hypothetical protein